MSEPTGPPTGPPPGPPAQSVYTCPWCRTQSAGAARSCPGCGAPVDVTLKTADSGWIELPAAADMAHIQLGQSSLQIEGTLVPSADFNLAVGDSLYFPHHELLWKADSVVLNQMGLRGGFKRLMAGLPVHMLTAAGPGHIAFSRDAAGEMLAIPMQPGSSIDVREHLLMVATSSVAFDWHQSGVWYSTRNGDDTETHYPIGQYIDRFSAGQLPGLLVLHAHGNGFVRNLAQGQSILVKPQAVLYKDSTVQMQLHFEHPNMRGWSSWRNWGNRFIWLRLWGPGRIAIQSEYAQHHDEGNRLVRYSNATQQNW